MNLQGYQGRPGQGAVAERKRSDPPARRGHEAAEVPVTLAEVGGMRPTTNHLRRVIKAAQKTLLVEKKLLPLAVRR
jgi:hypothetical protein